MITLSKEQIKKLHKKLIEKTGGLNGVRDEDIVRIGLDLASGKMNDIQLRDFILKVSV